MEGEVGMRSTRFSTARSMAKRASSSTTRRQGFRVRQEGDLEVWKKPLAEGVAVGLFNRSAAAAQIKVTWAELGIDKTNPIVRDLWAYKDLQSPQEFSAEVPSHGVVMLKVK